MNRYSSFVFSRKGRRTRRERPENRGFSYPNSHGYDKKAAHPNGERPSCSRAPFFFLVPLVFFVTFVFFAVQKFSTEEFWFSSMRTRSILRKATEDKQARSSQSGRNAASPKADGEGAVATQRTRRSAPLPPRPVLRTSVCSVVQIVQQGNFG